MSLVQNHATQRTRSAQSSLPPAAQVQVSRPFFANLTVILVSIGCRVYRDTAEKRRLLDPLEQTVRWLENNQLKTLQSRIFSPPLLQLFLAPAHRCHRHSGLAV